jgi:uncharacterized protein (TIGR02996 family)
MVPPMKHTLADEIASTYAAHVTRIYWLVDGVLDRLQARGEPHPNLTPQNVIVDGAWISIAGDDDPVSPTSNVHAIGDMLHQLVAGRDAPAAVTELIAICRSSARPTVAMVRERFRHVGWITPPNHMKVPAWQPPFTARDAKEQALADTLRATPGDTATRQVYADWLEGNGFDARARFLRDDGVRDDPKAIVPLAPVDDVAWRAIAARAPTAGCAVHCPQQWDEKLPTKFDNERTCPACAQRVHYCASADDAKLFGIRGEAIAIDASLSRSRTLEAYLAGRQIREVNLRGVPTMPDGTPFHPTNPPRPLPPFPSIVRPDEQEERGVLARFFGWLKK